MRPVLWKTLYIHTCRLVLWQNICLVRISGRVRHRVGYSHCVTSKLSRGLSNKWHPISVQQAILCNSIEWIILYTGWLKKVSCILWRVFQQSRIIFKNSFTVALSRKFAIKRSLQIPTHLNGVATLPCEILMSENIAYPICCGTVF